MNDVVSLILSGIVGGVAVYYVPVLIRYFVRKVRPILVYQLDDNGNDQGRRRVWHSFGCAVKDPEASNGRAWEHTGKSLNVGHATCYGPYTKEIPFHGQYKARFRIKTIGLNQSDRPLVVLDVTHGEPSSTNGQISMLGLPLVEKKVLCSEFQDGRYKDFDVYFDYDGQSLIEFRCAVENPDNFQGRAERILFDNVQLFHAPGVFS